MTVYLSVDELIQINLEMVKHSAALRASVIAWPWKRPQPGLKLVATETSLKRKLLV